MPQMTFEQACELFGYTPKGLPMDTEGLAKLRGVSKRTVEGDRVRGVGPRYFQPPGTRRVLYAERDVLEWLASGMKHSTSDNATRVNIAPRKPGEALRPWENAA